MRLYHDDNKDHVRPRSIPHISDDTRMGILLVLIGLLAFGAYIVFYLVSFALDAMP